MNGIQLTDFVPDVNVKKDINGKITSGLVVGDILRQNQALILLLHQGELKENPTVGAGISDMLLDNDPIYWRLIIKEQLQMDNEYVKAVDITITGIKIEAEYK